MERTHTNISDASTIVGGEPVGEDIKRRIYGFNLPFSSHRLSLPLSSLMEAVESVTPVFHSDKVEPLTWNAPYDAAVEDAACRSNFVNPRTHAVKSQTLNMSPLQTSSIPDLDGTIVVMGGYRGSTLRDRNTGRQVWVPLKVGLNMRKADLELGLDDDAEWNAHEKMYSDSMLTHVGPIDISKKLLRRLRQQKTARVFDWGYDWRLSCTYNSGKFIDYLKKLAMHDPRGAIIVAHSMGGLVAHHALQRLLETSKSQKLIRGIIYVGSPSECPPILGPLRLNDPVLFAKEVLTPKVNFTMRSSFVFLPDNGECFVDSKDPNKQYPIDYWNVEEWIKYSLSPCVSQNPALRKAQLANSSDEELDYDEAVAYLKRTLARTREFRDELKPLPDKTYPPMAVIYGNTLPTVVGAKVSSPDEIATTKFETPLYGSGDGVVFRRSLLPLSTGFEVEKYKIKVISTKDGHIGLLANTSAVGEAISHILESEGIKPTYSPVKKKRFATTRARVHSININPWSKAKSLFKRDHHGQETAATTPQSKFSNVFGSVNNLSTILDSDSEAEDTPESIRPPSTTGTSISQSEPSDGKHAGQVTVNKQKTAGLA